MRTSLGVVLLMLLAVACSSGTSVQRDPDNAASSSGTPVATSGAEGGCTQIDPWSPSGQSPAPCPPGGARASQPVLDPFDAGTR